MLRLQISKSRIGIFLRCPRSYYYQYVDRQPSRTDYPRLAGVTFHAFVQQLYRPTKEPRPFFYKTLASARGAYFHAWQRALKENAAKLVRPDSNEADKFFGVGIACLQQYWKDNVGLARPRTVEQRYVAPHPRRSGVLLQGIFDQLRDVPLEWVAAIRPELVTAGQLDPAYDPVVIVDMKTEYQDYDASSFLPNPTSLDQARVQHSLHTDIQPSMYIWLYYQQTGKWPIGFLWYHIRTGKTFFTCRDANAIDEFFGVVDYFLDNLAAGHFPRHADRHCRRCDYLTACAPNGQLVMALPGGIPTITPTPLQAVPTPAKRSKPPQLKLPMPLPTLRKASHTPAPVKPATDDSAQTVFCFTPPATPEA